MPVVSNFGSNQFNFILENIPSAKELSMSATYCLIDLIYTSGTTGDSNKQNCFPHLLLSSSFIWMKATSSSRSLGCTQSRRYHMFQVFGGTANNFGGLPNLKKYHLKLLHDNFLTLQAASNSFFYTCQSNPSSDSANFIMIP